MSKESRFKKKFWRSLRILSRICPPPIRTCFRASELATKERLSKNLHQTSSSLDSWLPRHLFANRIIWIKPGKPGPRFSTVRILLRENQSRLLQSTSSNNWNFDDSGLLCFVYPKCTQASNCKSSIFPRFKSGKRSYLNFWTLWETNVMKRYQDLSNIVLTIYIDCLISSPNTNNPTNTNKASNNQSFHRKLHFCYYHNHYLTRVYCQYAGSSLQS